MAEFTPEAEEELSDAAAWYDARESGLGARFLAELVEISALLDERPSLGARWKAPGVMREVRRVPLRSFPFLVTYVLNPHPSIVAVAHASRRPGYFRERLR